MQVERGNVDEARALWERAVAADAGCVDALCNLGNLCRQQEQLQGKKRRDKEARRQQQDALLAIQSTLLF